MELYTVYILSASCLALSFLWTYRQKQPRLPYAPGPKRLKVLGNLLDMPTKYQWVKFKEMSVICKSDIIYLNAMGSSFIVLNSLDTADELLDKRSTIYSGRVHLPMLHDLMGWGWLMAHLPYGDAWRAQRRLYHQELNVKAAQRKYPLHVQASHVLLDRLHATPERWQKHLTHHIGSQIVDVAYGFDVLPENDPFISMVEESLDSLNEATVPGRFLVDFIPILKYVPPWFPGAGFRTQAKEWRQLAGRVRSDPFQAMKDRMRKGEGRPSFASNCLQAKEHEGHDEAYESSIRDAAAMFYIAGVDTTVSTLEYFVLAMTMYPDVQSKAQSELDRVLGQNQLPSFEDQDSLPYLAAVLKEVQRYFVVVPLGVPHMLEKDDEYRGYHLPGGSVVMANTWAILHDERLYQDPFEFRPERFLKDGKIDPDVVDPQRAAFGHGRRICPGIQLAKNTMWITAGYILASFKIEKALDSNGNVVEPSGNCDEGLVNHPEPFECKFTARSIKKE